LVRHPTAVIPLKVSLARFGWRTAVLVIPAIILGAVSASTSLPDIKSIPALKLDPVLDLSDHPEAGLPWIGRISLNGEFVFYDAKLRRVMVMPLSGRGGRIIGAYGEGPGEYQSVLDLRLEENGILILDARGRLLEYGWDGRLRRDNKLPRPYEKILGRSRGFTYFVARSISAESYSDKAIVRWREGEDPASLYRRSADVLLTKASSLDGKEMAGGMMTLSEPAFALLEDGFAASAGSRYRIQVLDMAGKDRAEWDIKAPSPEFYGRMFGAFKDTRSAFAIRDIFAFPGFVAVIGNFFLEGKPRLDVFSRDGNRTSSWLIPLTCEAPYSRCQLDTGYLIHFSSDEGTRIFRVLSLL